MKVIIHAVNRQMTQDNYFDIECAELSDLAVYNAYVLVKSSDNVQFIIPWELIDYIEQDMSEHVDELQEGVLEIT